MRFKGIDLNLLLVLDILIDRRSVTRAAEHLHISQPAISAALSRLRGHFNDPLLVLHGKQMIPTAYAMRLQPQLKAVLADLDALVSTSAQFDPATSTRTFRLMASDFILVTVLGDFLPMIESTAPGIRFVVTPTSDLAIAMLEAGELDLIITPHNYLSDRHPMMALMEERHVVAGWTHNPLMAQPTTIGSMMESRFISAVIGKQKTGSYAINELRGLGYELDHALTVSYFAALPHMLIGTRYMAILHESMARKFARHLPICFWPLPVEIPLMQTKMQCHRAHASDPAIVWLIEQFSTWARQVFPETDPGEPASAAIMAALATQP
jgi:DNA-binding transcriptional LysR family regulator